MASRWSLRSDIPFRGLLLVSAACACCSFGEIPVYCSGASLAHPCEPRARPSPAASHKTVLYSAPSARKSPGEPFTAPCFLLLFPFCFTPSSEPHFTVIGSTQFFAHDGSRLRVCGSLFRCCILALASEFRVVCLYCYQEQPSSSGSAHILSASAAAGAEPLWSALALSPSSSSGRRSPFLHLRA